MISARNGSKDGKFANAALSTVDAVSTVNSTARGARRRHTSGSVASKTKTAWTACGSGTPSGLSDETPSDGRTIRLVERGGSSTIVDNAPRGNPRMRLLSAGDFWAGTMKLYADSGERAGSLYVVCTATVSGQESHTRFQCQGTVRLADGTLAIQALIERHHEKDDVLISYVCRTRAIEDGTGSKHTEP